MLSGTSRNAIIWFFLALFLVSIYLLGRLLMPFISVLILAAVVTGIFKPFYIMLRRNARPGFASVDKSTSPRAIWAISISRL